MVWVPGVNSMEPMSVPRSGEDKMILKGYLSIDGKVVMTLAVPARLMCR